MTSERAIGGELEIRAADFCADGGQSAWPVLAGKFELRCDSGRTALLLALVDWRKKRPASGRAWVPSYICESVINAVGAAGYDIAWYDDRPGEEPLDGFAPARDDIVIVVHYFGFPNALLSELLERRAETSYGIVEDCVQAPYTQGVGVEGDYAISSLRKWWPAPDGAAVHAKQEMSFSLAETDEEFVSTRLAAKLLRGAGQCESKYLSWVEQSEKSLKPIPRKVSWLSSQLLEAVPKVAACARRRSNWSTLSEGLEAIGGLKPLFLDLPDHVVPLAFPITIEGRLRDQLRDHFRKQRIFCPVHWPFMAGWPDKSRRLSEDILSLPIDQRYDEADMERILRVARFFFS
jgi:hypothetical protein